jgi:hypothetical protein
MAELSPYVSLYIARGQAEAIRKVLRGETARAADVQRALLHLEAVLDARSADA